MTYNVRTKYHELTPADRKIILDLLLTIIESDRYSGAEVGYTQMTLEAYITGQEGSKYEPWMLI